jgi:7-carboxy-7-deazaguanine synthase
VLIETSGAFDISAVDPRAIRIMDLKCPGSGESERNLWSNLDHLTARDELKFVIADRTDYEWARSVIADRGLDAMAREGRLRAIHFSPVWGRMEFTEIAAWILEDRLPVRFQIQQHKVIWGEMKGV